MSKITINAVFTVVRLVISFMAKCIRLLYAISDLVDDGCVNASVTRPDWMVSISSVLANLESLIGHMRVVEENISTEV